MNRTFNCPTVHNLNQVDYDQAHAGDICDNCKHIANGSQGDFDADSVGDVCDNCVTVVNREQDPSACACPCFTRESIDSGVGGEVTCCSQGTFNYWDGPLVGTLLARKDPSGYFIAGKCGAFGICGSRFLFGDEGDLNAARCEAEILASRTWIDAGCPRD